MACSKIEWINTHSNALAVMHCLHASLVTLLISIVFNCNTLKNVSIKFWITQLNFLLSHPHARTHAHRTACILNKVDLILDQETTFLNGEGLVILFMIVSIPPSQDKDI